MTQLLEMARRRMAPVGLGLLIAIATLLAALLPARPASAQGTVPLLPTAPAWLEPRGLSIVDMVGYVPEEQLHDAILMYETGTGLVQYDSGSRTGNTVVVDVRMTPRYGTSWTEVGCLAQPAAYDQWLSTMPASTVQIFANGKDITSRIVFINYAPANLVEPQFDASGYLRYPRTASVRPGGANPAPIPANGSCQILFEGIQSNITARFTIAASPQVSVTPVGSVTFNAHSYIGVGGRGKLGPLVDQLLRRYGTRHDAFDLNVPAGADYMFVKYGPTAVDPYYGGGNLPGSGTYRFELASSNWLAVDNVSSMGIPTRGNWRDADQMGSSAYLAYEPLRGRIKTPEYFLPPGIPFDQCMVSGGCPAALLDAIYNQTFPVQVYFYKVDRLPAANLMRVPLKMVGASWSAADISGAELAEAPFQYAQAPLAADAGNAFSPAEALQQQPIYLPIIGKSNPPPPPLPPDDPTGCPCGWFDAQGQMYDFIPPQ